MIKDLKKKKKDEMERRSLLIYGREDMQKYLIELDQKAETEKH